jgi:Heterokaryon incompatibility protein (HET)
MRLLQYNNDGGFSLTKDFAGGEIPEYAILSHTWGADTEEVTYKDVIDSTGKDKIGYEKIQFCGEQARHDGLKYFWVDTCCIDKSNSIELQRSINSMFRWYRDSARCYVFLADVPQEHELPWKSAFRGSRWFERSWTLQELIAPKSVEFFSKYYKFLGDKKSLERQICEITRIPSDALRGIPLPTFSVTERMSWAETRKATYEEDMVYSLLGIFDVYMSLIYGEGRDNARRRLREAIDKKEKGALSSATRIGYNHSEVIDLGRDQIRGLFGPV